MGGGVNTSIESRMSVNISKYKPEIRPDSRLGLVIRRFKANKLAVAGLCLFILYCAAAVFGPMLAPRSPSAIDAANAFAPPSLAHPMGTDRLGRDVFARVMIGARISMVVAIGVVLFSTILGMSIGLIAGFNGGIIDEILMRIIDVFFAFPTILLALVVVAVLGTGLDRIVIALGISYTIPMARIARASALSVSEEEYIMAAKSYGERTRRILFREMAPNMLTPIIVQATIVFAFSILVEASLSYLGVSAAPGTPSWGVIISQGQAVIMVAPWMVLGPGLTMAIAVLGLTFLGVGLRDAFDPKTEVDISKGGGV